MKKNYFLTLILTLFISGLSFGQVINEFQPNANGTDPDPASFELKGTPGASFSGWILSVESDPGSQGTIDRASSVTGTFDNNGLLVVTAPDLENPSFTLILVDDFTGVIGSTDIDTDNDGTADDVSSWTTVFDAIGIPDNTGDEAFLYADEIGGTDFSYSGDEPKLVFRDGTSGDLYAVNDPDNSEVYDVNGTEIVALGSFDTSPYDPTFGAVNPTYTLATGPVILTGNFSGNLSYESGNGPSTEGTFTVEGTNLTDDILVSSPSSDFEISETSQGTFSSSINLAEGGTGLISETTIYVRLKAGLAIDDYSVEISISSAGAETEIITLSGSVYASPTNSLVITGAYDGPLSGGTPKGIELYALEDIEDLSIYGISSVSNGGGSSAGIVEYNFPADAVTAGTYIYLATESTQFNTFFGINPTYVNGVVSINGDDSIELYEGGAIIDTFGTVDCDPNASGTTCPEWEHTDGWAYRNDGTGPEGTTFTISNWTYSGADALDGESDNASATTPFPIGTYSNTPPPSGNSVTVATSQAWNAYVNAFNVSDNGYAFGFPYTVSDLRATPTATSMTLEPNTAIWTAEASNSAWFDQGATTQTALLYIEASSYIEDNTLAGSDLTFTGNVSVSDLGSEYTVVAFVKALDPNAGYATVVNNTADISSTGDFTTSATAAELAAGYIIQYGFSVTGPLADPADTTLGSVVIGEATAGVDDNSFVNVSVYPNPSNSNWNFRTGNTVITSVEVFNLLGKRVVSQNNNSTELSISTQGLTSGIYIARITTEQGVKSVKLIRE